MATQENSMNTPSAGTGSSEARLRLFYSIAAVGSLIAIMVVIAASLKSSVYNTDDCLWTVIVERGDTVLVVSQIVAGGNADRAGIQVGDTILSINGISTQGINAVSINSQKILNEAPVNVPIPYVVKRGKLTLPLQVNLSRQYIFIQFVLPAFALLWLIIGTLVVLTRPSGIVQRRFFMASAMVVFAFAHPFTGGGGIGTTILRLVWVANGLLFLPAWVQFCESFPVQQQLFASRGRKLALYAPSLVIFLMVLFMFVWYGTSGELLRTVLKITEVVPTIQFWLYFGVGVWLLFRGYSRLPDSVNRRPMRVILGGTVLASAAFIYIGVLEVSASPGIAVLYPQYLFPLLLILALPISFGYVIFKYQIMDFRQVVKTTVVYTITMALLLTSYLGLAYGTGQILGSLLTKDFEAIVRIFSFIVFLLLFEPVRRQIQVAVENRFFPHYRDYTRQLESYSARVNETVGIDAVAGLMARTLKEELDVQGVCIVIDPGEGELNKIAFDCDFICPELGHRASTALRRVLRQYHDVVVLATHREPDFVELGNAFPYVIGLYAQGNVIGGALISDRRDGESIRGSQMPFIRGVAAHGAAAFEVARLYQGEIARQRYQEELETARRIQASLLPAAMPDILGITISAFSRPAQAVGGDYYEVIQLPNDKFLVMVADVSGKGLPASLYMAELHGMVRMVSSLYATPKEMLVALNDQLSTIIERGSFITASLLLFDTRRKSVSFARAGHTPIVRRNGTQVDTLIPIGLPLGIRSVDLFNASLQQYTVEYEPGETFILYSDGVSEAMNGRREEFGDGRLLDVISGTAGAAADELCATLLASVEEFRDGAEQNDDITVVVIRVEKEVERVLLPHEHIGKGRNE